MNPVELHQFLKSNLPEGSEFSLVVSPPEEENMTCVSSSVKGINLMADWLARLNISQEEDSYILWKIARRDVELLVDALFAGHSALQVSQKIARKQGVKGAEKASKLFGNVLYQLADSLASEHHEIGDG